MPEETFDDSSSRQDAAPTEPAKTLAQRIEEAHAFFDPQNLADILIQYEEDEIGLVIIDIQKKYCDQNDWGASAEAARVAKRVQSLASKFREAGIPIYAVYFATANENPDGVGFYKFLPEPQDTKVVKNKRSAFRGGNIREVLDRDHKKLLLACGVCLNECVRETVTDAVDQGFDVVLLRDLSAACKWDNLDTDLSLSVMTRKGIAVLQSEQVLEALQISKGAARAPKRKATAAPSCR